MCVYFHGWPFDTGQLTAVLFPGEDHLSTPSCPHMSMVPCVGLRSGRLSSWHVHWCPPGWSHILVVMLVRLTGTASNVARKHNLPENADPMDLTTFLPIFLFSWALNEGVFCTCVHWHWAPHLCNLIGCIFLQWFQDRVFLWFEQNTLITINETWIINYYTLCFLTPQLFLMILFWDVI